MYKSELAILFLGKQEDEHCLRALRFCQRNFTSVSDHLGKWKDPLPEEVSSWEGDIIVSYLSRWILPAAVLRKPKTAAINFHPASPEYPGIGCINFALYEDASDYGVTCHHMAAKVDTGKIIAVKCFPVFKTDDVASLLARTYDHQIILFYEIMETILSGEPLPSADAEWTRSPFTRKQFNKLFAITPDMSKEEIGRRIRATTFGEYKPVLDLQGHLFEPKITAGD